MLNKWGERVVKRMDNNAYLEWERGIRKLMFSKNLS